MDKNHGNTYETSNLILGLVDINTYDSEFSPENIFSYQMEEEIPEGQEEKDFDFEKYCGDLGKVAAKVLKEQADNFICGEESGIKSITSNGKVHNPRHYNLWNGGGQDFMDVEIEVSPDFMSRLKENFRKWMEDDLDGNGRVGNFVRDNYTSYDGFFSYIPDSLEGILNDILDGFDLDRLVGVYATLVAVDNGYFRGDDPYDGRTPYMYAREELYETLCDEIDYFDYATLGPVEG